VDDPHEIRQRKDEHLDIVLRQGMSARERPRRHQLRALRASVTFHGLRHTHFTNLLREGVDPKIASDRAGHSSVSITLDIYSHAVPGLQEDAAARIDASLAKLMEA
jgi:integrase